MSEEKQYPPSKKKLRKARSEGNILKSQLLTSATQVVVGVALLILGARLVLIKFQILLYFAYSEGFLNPSYAFQEAMRVSLEVLIALFLPVVFFTVCAEFVQIGFHFGIPRKKTLNLPEGLTRIFHGLRSSPLIFAKVVLVLVVLVWLCSNFASSVPGAIISRESEAFWRMFRHFLIVLTGSLFVVGVVDYIFKRKRYFSELSMSLDELRQELKEEEGDPQIKTIRGSLHRALARGELIRRLKNAKVVVVERG